ncbi:ATP-dependent Clp protease ATP-binding subunit [Bacillus ginsengihumi]|uniref:ATP-dependent Clp protease ATP-binding subunit n=1 Tax=Heyndrickxia ginsengihumi TaxID=363870 RepID=A0A6M0P1Q8_9BACI|nr:AAA family ATPase [Heyndrickxia ginsengihumi]NEY18564.1 ATP-dependent Clp protease ATP-binding subunit [Heyndrickxia ginsengihumi]
MKVKIFYGPDNAFNEFIEEHSYTTMNEVMMQVVEVERSFTIRTEDSSWTPNEYSYNTIVCYRQEYASMTTNLINNIMLLFRNVECENIYFQNPPNNIVESLQRNHVVEVKYHDYGKLAVEKLIELKKLYQERIIGQEHVLNVLLPVINVSRVRHSNKPIVIMFYGPPGVGKTETAKIISEAIYANDNIKRFQLSMYQTEHAYRFLFGSDPQEDSLAKNLLYRETNVVLFDEFDKVHPNLYSAFYELFDEGKIVDRNYTAKVDNAIFICTSNYSTKDEIEKSVGSAIFSRITECIRFEGLSYEDKYSLLVSRFNESIESLPQEEKDILSSADKEDMLEGLAVELKNLTNSRVIKNTIEKYLSLKILKERGIL